MNYINNAVDISEDDIQQLSPKLLCILLRDHSAKYYTEQKLCTTSNLNPDEFRIIWATTDYEKLGDKYQFNKPITPELITGKYKKTIVPRAIKSRQAQTVRVRQMAEVFTPAWICNAQNNLIDEAWFERKNVFNTETIRKDGSRWWEPNPEKITFPQGKTWHDYINARCLEITCGEAPYLVSRYDSIDAATLIPIEQRIGLLDRKLRVVSENTENSKDWLEWAEVALQNTYGYEWQGDNLLLARENLLFTFIDFYFKKFGEMPLIKSIEYAAYIISWNIWQMDGIKNVSPLNSISDEMLEKYRTEQQRINSHDAQGVLFEPPANRYETQIPFCVIKNWKSKKIEKFIESFKTK